MNRGQWAAYEEFYAQKKARAIGVRFARPVWSGWDFVGHGTALKKACMGQASFCVRCSNYCQSCLDCLLANASIVPAVNQFELHVGMGDDPEGLVSYTARKGIVVQVRKPSATSRLKTALLRAVQCGVSPTGNPGC